MFQVCALIRGGVTLVVSPLLSLMQASGCLMMMVFLLTVFSPQDQIMHLERLGVR